MNHCKVLGPHRDVRYFDATVHSPLSETAFRSKWQRSAYVWVVAREVVPRRLENMGE